MQSLTPREAQVRRFVERLEAAHEFEFAQEFPARAAEAIQAGQPVMSQTVDEHGNRVVRFGLDPAIPPREQIADAAVANFIAAVTAVQPWKGLGDFTDAELGALRRRAVTDALR